MLLLAGRGKQQQQRKKDLKTGKEGQECKEIKNASKKTDYIQDQERYNKQDLQT